VKEILDLVLAEKKVKFVDVFVFTPNEVLSFLAEFLRGLKVACGGS
jgi:hypothetical protein